MKTSIMVKLGISMLIMLMTVGMVSASGGSSYSSAEGINVPYGDIWIWSGETGSADWYQFNANNGDDVYVDLQKRFADYGGEMKVHDKSSGDIAAWVSTSQVDHWAYNVAGNPQPRIEIIAGSQFDYQFIAGRY